MLKSNGGVFGRKPTFKNVKVDEGGIGYSL
jgi:hypothetical protein